MFKEIRDTLSGGLVCLVAVGGFSITSWAIWRQSAEGRDPVVIQTEGTDSVEHERISIQLVEQESEPKFVVIYEADEEIAEVIFGEAEMTVEEARTLGVRGLEERSAGDTLRVQYPKVVMIKDEETSSEWTTFVKSIRFLDKRGVVKKEVPLLKMVPGERWSWARVSKGKKYIGVNNVYKYAGEITIDAEFIMLDDEGRELWKMKHDLATIIPSPNGKYIVGILDAAIGDAPIYVYNERGLVREIEKDDQAWDVDFSKDGGYFAVTVVTTDWKMETRIHSQRHAGHLMVLNAEGDELWRKENIARGNASFCRVKISDDDIITMITSEYKIYHFDKKGNLTREEQGNLELFKRFKKR